MHSVSDAGRWLVIDGDAHGVFRDQLHSIDACSMQASAIPGSKLNQKDKTDKRIISFLLSRNSYKPARHP